MEEKQQLIYKTLKIKSVKKIGIKKVYDMEMPTEDHNFVLKGGIVAHNCKSHAQSYATTAYACAFLKHHYPLQWWCAVLSNAEKNEVNEDFWQYCGHLVDLPDIKYSSDSFTVKNSRIKAPLSMLNGIGEKAHQQLCNYMPYDSIQDFCDKIQKYKESLAVKTQSIKIKKNKKTGEESKVLVEKVKLGISALNRRVVYTLIISGCMDSLFDKEYSTVEKLALYEEALSKATGEKIVQVADNFKNIDDLTKFQLQKTILPAFSTPLLPLLQGKFGIKQTSSGFSYLDKYGDEHLFISNVGIAAVESKTFIKNPIERVCAAFVLSTRPFTYQSGKKTACEITFDIDGKRYNMVRWPDKDGSLPEHIGSKLDGTISLIHIRKYDASRPFTIGDVKILYPKIDLKRKDIDE